MGKENKFLRWLGEVFNGTQLVALSFMLVILAGAFLFMLPISTQNGEGLTFLDAMFTATSATCVTGLTVIDVGNQLTWFGKMVLIVLIQIGGLGIMTMTTVVMVIAGRKVSLRERLLLQESMSGYRRAQGKPARAPVIAGIDESDGNIRRGAHCH